MDSQKQTGIATAAVGMITEPPQAEEILQNAQADAIFMARELGAEIEYIAKQYGCAIDLRKAESAGKNQKVKKSKDKKSLWFGRQRNLFHF